MSAEAYKQVDLLTGELVDTRTTREKARDRQAAQPCQGVLFSQRELAQFGVRARPTLPLPPGAILRLAVEDPRTPEEREQDALCAAQEQTEALFLPPAGAQSAPPGPEPAPAEAYANHP